MEPICDGLSAGLQSVVINWPRPETPAASASDPLVHNKHPPLSTSHVENPRAGRAGRWPATRTPTPQATWTISDHCWKPLQRIARAGLSTANPHRSPRTMWKTPHARGQKITTSRKRCGGWLAPTCPHQTPTPLHVGCGEPCRTHSGWRGAGQRPALPAWLSAWPPAPAPRRRQHTVIACALSLGKCIAKKKDGGTASVFSPASAATAPLTAPCRRTCACTAG